MARSKSANMTTSNSLTSSARRNTCTGALKWRCGHSAERCFHTAHVTTRCADEYSRLSAELPHSFHLLYVTSLKSMPKGLVCCDACMVAHFTDNTASSLFGQMGSRGYFASWMQLQKKQDDNPLFTNLHKSIIVFSLFEYAQSELN